MTDDRSAMLPPALKSRENVLVLYLTQALLGLVSPNLLGVSIELEAERLTVHFAFGTRLAEDAEDVEEVMGDLDALLDNERGLGLEATVPAIHVGHFDDWPGLRFRRVYEARSRATAAG